MEQYQASLKYKRDWQNTLDYAVEEAVEKAVEKAIEEGMEKVAKDMKLKGYALNEISELTGLPQEKIKSL